MIITNSKAKKKGAHFEHLNYHLLSILIVVYHDLLSDAKVQRDVPTIHLFSNILDIDDYNSQHLLSIVDSIITCCNYFVCVSPYIDDIKTARLNSFMMHFRNKPTFVLYHDVENTKYGEFWQCNNSFKKGHFSHGTALSCRDYDSTGCSNKWTRVLKVFSV